MPGSPATNLGLSRGSISIISDSALNANARVLKLHDIVEPLPLRTRGSRDHSGRGRAAAMSNPRQFVRVRTEPCVPLRFREHKNTKAGFRRFLEENRRLPPGYCCPLFEKRRASSRCYRVISACFLISAVRVPHGKDYSRMCPGRHGSTFGLQSYLLFVGSTFQITQARLQPSPHVVPSLALLFRRRRSAAGVGTNATFFVYAPCYSLRQEDLHFDEHFF